MKIRHLVLPLLAASQDSDDTTTLLGLSQEDATLLSLKMKVHATLESGVNHLLDVVGSRNVTAMSNLLQNLVEETISEDSGSEGPYKLDGDVTAALDMIKRALIGDIRAALKDAHRADQVELHEQILCFGKCEETKKQGASSCPEYCDGSAHKTCRDKLLETYTDHIEKCRALDDYVRDWSKENCPKFEKKCCLLSHTTFNCGGICETKIAGMEVDESYGTWIKKQITTFESAFDRWTELHKECTKSYHDYAEKDAECDCMQADCETNNGAYESCHYLNCEDVYNKCWAGCEASYTATNEAKECLEKDRKIDWSATEKIECYVNVLLEQPTKDVLLATCGAEDCFNKYREQMYNKCNEICVEVDFEGEWGNHARRQHKAGDYSGRLTDVKDQSTHQGADIDVSGEGDNEGAGVYTRHRGEGENRCTSHLDLDYQLPPCCQPCEPRPSPPCVGRREDDNDKSSYMWLHYGQYGHFSEDKIADFEAKKCHAGEHSLVYAYNLCDCIEYTAPSPAPPASCTKAKACDAGTSYDYPTTTTTTIAKVDLPPSNCPTPEHSKVCHFWGDPHFTHVFGQHTREAKKGGRQYGHKLFDYNPSGVFNLADNEDGSFEAQAFFCPYHGTSTGVGLAMRFGDDLIHVVRGEATAGSISGGTGGGKYANLHPSNEKPESTFTEFFVNGKKVSWKELGDSTGTRGRDVSGNGGLSLGHAYFQQLKTDHESAITFLPVCAGNGEDTLVEVGAPMFAHVYEHAVTIRTSHPGSSGLCSVNVDTFNSKIGEHYRAPPTKNLFSTMQMKSLCGMCGLPLDGTVCGAPSHDVAPEEVCESSGANYDEVQKACAKEFKDSQWLAVCILEACASGDGSLAISKIEEHLQERFVREEVWEE